jgi:hypothetical protein
LLFLSASASEKFSELNFEFENAWRKFDKKLMVSIANKITKNEILNNDGFCYLKLKIHALTFANNYQSALLEIEKYKMVYYDNAELYIAGGILAYKNNSNSAEYFDVALNILSTNKIIEKSAYEKLCECYILLVLGKEKEKLDILYYSLNDDDKKLVNYYKNLDRNELLLHPPIDFVALEPFPDNIGTGNEDWWK